MSSQWTKYINSLVYFDGYKKPDFIPEGPTQRIWSNMGIAIKKGATWGDFAVYSRTELDEVLAERSTRSRLPMVIAKSVQQSAVIEREAPSEVVSYDTTPVVAPDPMPFVMVKKPTLRERLDKFSTPSVKRALCLGCSTFCVHSKPPDSWNASDKKRYCCLGCRDSSGKKHADRCQKHKH